MSASSSDSKSQKISGNAISLTPINLWLHGSSGRMGREIYNLAVSTDSGFNLLGGSAHVFEGEHEFKQKAVNAQLLQQAIEQLRVHLILDFSTIEGNKQLLDTLTTRSKPHADKPIAVVIGTTGIPQNTLDRWRSLGESSGNCAVLLAPNTSIGILTLVKAAVLATQQIMELGEMGFDIEIVETHHKFKKDAPSGTAKFIADSILKELPQHRTIFNRKGLRQDLEIGMHAVRGGAVFGEHEVRMIGDAEEITISHRAFSRTLFAKGALALGKWLMAQKPGFYGLLDVH